jgi:hypothetical protein
VIVSKSAILLRPDLGQANECHHQDDLGETKGLNETFGRRCLRRERLHYPDEAEPSVISQPILKARYHG